MEGALPPDLELLLDAASDFASYPGPQNDTSAKEFLDHYPLPLILSTLQERLDAPSSATTLIPCLERIFKTKYGASLIPQYSYFVQAGLQSDSEMVRSLACKVVYFLLENTDITSAIQLIKNYDVHRLLLICLVDGNEEVAAASSDAIIKLARFPEGFSIIFPRDGNLDTDLKKIATHASSLARVRILALIARLFSLSGSAVFMSHLSSLLSLFEAEISNTNDMLTSLSALELLYEDNDANRVRDNNNKPVLIVLEGLFYLSGNRVGRLKLAESPYNTSFLLRSKLLQLLSSLISDNSIDPLLRSRAILLTGRLLSAVNTYYFVDENSVKISLVAIDGRLEMLKDKNTDERESALESLGQIGTSTKGANFLLMGPSPVARHVVASAFGRSARGVVLAALHALGNIAGIGRSSSTMLLENNAEECLRHLIFTTAANSSKLTPSGLFLSVLQQEPEIRLAAYRLISALVARRWCLVEVCSKQEIIDIVTDAQIETNKNGMDTRYSCCTMISKALLNFDMLNDPALAGIVRKIQEAVKRGPYLPKRVIESQPIVGIADRF